MPNGVRDGYCSFCHHYTRVHPFDPVTAWIAILPMKELVVLLNPGMDSGVMVTERAIAVPDPVRHGAGKVWVCLENP